MAGYTTVGKLRSMLKEINPDLPVVFAVGRRDYVGINVMALHETSTLRLKFAEYDHWEDSNDEVMYFEI